MTKHFEDINAYFEPLVNINYNDSLSNVWNISIIGYRIILVYIIVNNNHNNNYNNNYNHGIIILKEVNLIDMIPSYVTKYEFSKFCIEKGVV